jgi:murein DD-endopeptidase MepM/ murein hydrolase activator NlpD
LSKLKNRILMLTISFVLISSGLTASYSEHVFANKELQKELQKVTTKKKNVQNNMKEMEKKVEELKNEQSLIESELVKLDMKQVELDGEIVEKEEEIVAKEEEIVFLEAEINKMTASIAARDEALKERVRSMQKSNGAVHYLNVLLGSKSFSDFLERSRALNLILEQDKQIIDQYLFDKEDLENNKAEVKQILKELVQAKEELEQLLAENEQIISEKKGYLASLHDNEEHLHDEIHEAEEEKKLLADQEQAIKRELAEWKRREELRKKNGDRPEITDGNFMYPATGRVTSQFGKRWGSNHYGIDIGKNGRKHDVHIVASASGTVFSSYYSTSYGNVVFITHNIGGKIYTTVYAHMSKRFVSKGTRVKKGDVIGVMGNTGYSFGAHLHFELHKGMWNIGKTNAVDPIPYFPKKK